MGSPTSQRCRARGRTPWRPLCPTLRAHDPPRSRSRPHRARHRCLLRHRRGAGPPAGRAGPRRHARRPARGTACGSWPTSWPPRTACAPRWSPRTSPTRRSRDALVGRGRDAGPRRRHPGQQRRLLDHGPGARAAIRPARWRWSAPTWRRSSTSAAPFVPGMVERGVGAVLNVASTAAFQPLPGQAGYGASKAFVLSYTQAMAQELRGHGRHGHHAVPGPGGDGLRGGRRLRRPRGAGEALPKVMWVSRRGRGRRRASTGWPRASAVVIPGVRQPGDGRRWPPTRRGAWCCRCSPASTPR